MLLWHPLDATAYMCRSAQATRDVPTRGCPTIAKRGMNGMHACEPPSMLTRTKAISRDPHRSVSSGSGRRRPAAVCPRDLHAAPRGHVPMYPARCRVLAQPSSLSTYSVGPAIRVSHYRRQIRRFMLLRPDAVRPASIRGGKIGKVNMLPTAAGSPRAWTNRTGAATWPLEGSDRWRDHGTISSPRPIAR